MPRRMEWRPKRHKHKERGAPYTRRPNLPPHVDLLEEEVDDVIANEIAFEHYSVGPDIRDPESAWYVKTSGGYVESIRWDLTERPDDPDYVEDWKENPVLKSTTSLELEDLFAVSGRHWQGERPPESLKGLATYWSFGGETGHAYVETVIVEAIGAYQSYYGGSEEFVSEVGE